jgi:hypothetical protein
MQEEELDLVLELHRKWLHNEIGGKRAVLRGANFEKANLHESNLQRAGLADAVFKGADLSEANLSYADLRFTDLSVCCLRKARLVGADLRWAVLEGANLANANLARARLKGTALNNIIVNWTDRTLVSEILWQAAGENANRRMVAALVGRQDDWCWDKFLALAYPERFWALQELKKWIKEGDDAPDLLLTSETEVADWSCNGKINPSSLDLKSNSAPKQLI